MNITIEQLLEEVKKNTPEFEVGQCFETLRPFYPTCEEEDKNIIVEGQLATKPLAVDRKTKREFEKYDSPFRAFFKNKKKGDLLKVVEVNEEGAKCENLSLREEIRERFYKNRYIFVSYEDLITGSVKQVKRNISKFIEE